MQMYNLIICERPVFFFWYNDQCSKSCIIGFFISFLDPLYNCYCSFINVMKRTYLYTGRHAYLIVYKCNMFQRTFKKKKKSFCTMAVYTFFIHILRKYIYVQPLITLSQKKNTTVNYIIMPSKRKVIWEIWMLNHIIINC